MPASCCRRSWLALLASMLVDAPAAQAVWNVSAPNGIPAAIAAASPGDILVLTGGGPYDPFHLDRGLTIRGNGALVWSSAPGGTVTVAVPPGQVAHLDAIDFWGNSLGTPVSLGGNVRVDRCTFASRTAATALSIALAQVVIVDSSILAGGWTQSGIALQALDSEVTLRDCTVSGSNAGCHSFLSVCFPATTAAMFQNCTVQAERTTFRGGSHSLFSPAGNGAAAIDSTHWTGILRLANCTLTGGSSYSGTGGTALLYGGITPAELRSTGLIAGTPGGGTSTGLLNPTAPLLRLYLQPVWTRGQASTLMLSGDANTPHALFLTPAAGSTSTPLVVEPVWAIGAITLAAGLLDHAGFAFYSVPVPNVAALEHAAVWCQAASGTTFPLRASTIAGGVVR